MRARGTPPPCYHPSMANQPSPDSEWLQEAKQQLEIAKVLVKRVVNEPEPKCLSPATPKRIAPFGSRRGRRRR